MPATGICPHKRRSDQVSFFGSELRGPPDAISTRGELQAATCGELIPRVRVFPESLSNSRNCCPSPANQLIASRRSLSNQSLTEIVADSFVQWPTHLYSG